MTKGNIIIIYDRCPNELKLIKELSRKENQRKISTKSEAWGFEDLKLQNVQVKITFYYK